MWKLSLQINPGSLGFKTSLASSLKRCWQDGLGMGSGDSPNSALWSAVFSLVLLHSYSNTGHVFFLSYWGRLWTQSIWTLTEGQTSSWLTLWSKSYRNEFLFFKQKKKAKFRKSPLSLLNSPIVPFPHGFRDSGSVGAKFASHAFFPCRTVGTGADFHLLRLIWMCS